MLVSVRLGGFFGVVPRIKMMTGRRMRMVPRLLVLPGLMMLSSLLVVFGSMAEML